MLLNEIMELELHATVFYGCLSKFFNEDFDFWEMFELEEQRNIPMLERIEKSGNEDQDDKNNFTGLTAVKNHTEMLQNIMTEFRDVAPDKLIAYETALLTESFFYEFYTQRSNEESKKRGTKKLQMQDLASRHKSHADQIYSLIKRYVYKAPATFATLFNLSISMEQFAGRLYSKLAWKFREDPAVVEFMINMSNDEKDHETSIKSIAETISDDIKRKKYYLGKAIPFYLEIINIYYHESSMDLSLSDYINVIHNIENSEVNNIFEFMVMEFVSKREIHDLLIRQLQMHNQRLMDFTSRLKGI